jgi:hypothetical protein
MVVHTFAIYQDQNEEDGITQSYITATDRNEPFC